MNKVDINKYINFTIEYSFYGEEAYMIAPDKIITIIETELGMSYDHIKNYIAKAELHMDEEVLKKYFSSKSCTYEPAALEYYKKMIRIYRYRLSQLCGIIEAMKVLNDDMDEEDIIRMYIDICKEGFDLMINKKGAIVLSDLNRIINPLLYNFIKLKEFRIQADDIDNYAINPQVESYPVMALQAYGVDDEGLIPYSDRQIKKIKATEKQFIKE